VTQRDALEAWDGGATPDKDGPRVTLRRLFDRIESSETPATLWRAIHLGAADAVELVRGLAARVFRIPPQFAGWEFTDSPAEATAMVRGAGRGWRVMIQVKGGTPRAVDIRALRPGKPGFVYVGGVEFTVENFTQDPATRIMSITLAEK